MSAYFAADDRSSMYMVQDQPGPRVCHLPGGHQVGIGGTAFVEQGEAKTIRDISQFSIRIAKELPGVASRVVPAITDATGRVCLPLSFHRRAVARLSDP